MYFLMNPDYFCCVTLHVPHPAVTIIRQLHQIFYLNISEYILSSLE